MKKYYDILRESSLFKDIADGELSALLSCLSAKVVSYDEKYTVIAEGSPARYIGVMLSGSAQVTQVDYYGNRSIISRVEQGEVFGESFACAEVDEIPVSIIADEPCEVMFVDRDRVLHTCERACTFHRQIIFNLMRGLATKNIMFHQRQEITSKRTTREKLMTYLLLQAKNAGSHRFEIPFDRQELADYLEVDRSGLSAELSKLRREGVLKCRKNSFELL